MQSLTKMIILERVHLNYQSIRVKLLGNLFLLVIQPFGVQERYQCNFRVRNTHVEGERKLQHVI